MSFPPCFPSQAYYDAYYREWLRALDVERGRKDITEINYCVDCTEEYKAQMQDEGRCFPATCKDR